MPAKTNIPTGKALTDFVKHVREADLLLRGRDMDDAPEGAGSWRYLIAGWLEIEPKAVTPAMVATVKDADAKARQVGKPKAKAPAKGRKAPAKADAPADMSPAAFAQVFAAWTDEDRAAFVDAITPKD